MLTEQEKIDRREARKAEKKALAHIAKIEAEKNQKPVESITINIEWTKSRTWGSNPNATADVHYKDGTYHNQGGFKCSGCGYDKESTVIAEIYNTFLKYKLYGKVLKTDKSYNKEMNKKVYPYGLHADEHKYFDGGIGTNCYYGISKAIGGVFEHVASGKTFDVYKYTDKTVNKIVFN